MRLVLCLLVLCSCLVMACSSAGEQSGQERPPQPGTQEKERHAAEVQAGCDETRLKQLGEDLALSCKGRVDLPSVTLVEGQQSLQAVEDAALLTLSKDWIAFGDRRFSGQHVERDLLEFVKEELERSRQMAELRGAQPPHLLSVAIAKDVKVAQLAAVLKPFYELGYQTFQFVFDAGRINLGSYDPAVVAEVTELTRVEGLSIEKGEQQRAAIEAYIKRAATGCPEIGRPLEVNSRSICEQRMVAVVDAFKESRCACDLERVAVPLIMTSGDALLVAAKVRFAADGVQLNLDDGLRWAEAAPTVIKASGGVVAPIW